MRFLELSVGREDYGRIFAMRVVVLGVLLEVGAGHDIGRYLALGVPCLSRGYARRRFVDVKDWVWYADSLPFLWDRVRRRFQLLARRIAR